MMSKGDDIDAIFLGVGKLFLKPEKCRILDATATLVARSARTN